MVGRRLALVAVRIRGQRGRGPRQHQKHTGHEDKELHGDAMHNGRPTSTELAERVQNCSPPRGYEQCPLRHSGHGPRAPFLKWHRDMSQNAPLSVTSLAMLKTDTPSVSLVTMLEATDELAVGAFVADILRDSGWRVESLPNPPPLSPPPHAPLVT